MLSILILSVSSVEPTWSSYATDKMYSGEHRTISTDSWQARQPPVAPGAYTFKNQIYYSGSFSGAKYPSSETPQVILSMQGYKQDAPLDVNTFVGFDVKI